MATTPTSTAGSKETTHPAYAAFKASWQAALDVYEGTGGFLDETRPYLIPHPREWLDHSIKDSTTGAMVPNPTPSQPSPKLKMRRKLARYENVAATILDAVIGSLFREAPTRTLGKGDSEKTTPIQAWWGNCDGRGTSLDVFMRDAWISAAVFGHTPLLLEKPENQAETQADATLPMLRAYTPLDLIDWIVDENGELVSVKLLEAAPRESFESQIKATDKRVRVVDREKWTLYDHKGEVAKTGEHGFGVLPVVMLYGKRRPLTPVIGKSIMGDPQLYIDLYNLISEVRELLRNQTFAILNVPIGPDGSVQAEQEKMGQQSGTANVLFSSQAAQYISPEGVNVQVYHEHIDRLMRTVYRLTSLPWQGDTRDAESAESLIIKRQELADTLSAYADEVQRADRALTDLAYRAVYGEQWEKQQETDQTTIAYSDTFDPPNLEAVAARAAEMIGLDLGPTATKEIKKRAVRVALPDLDPEMQKQSDAEIDSQKILTAEEKRQEMLQGAAARLAAFRPNREKPDDDKAEDEGEAA